MADTGSYIQRGAKEDDKENKDKDKKDDEKKDGDKEDEDDEGEEEEDEEKEGDEEAIVNEADEEAIVNEADEEAKVNAADEEAIVNEADEEAAVYEVDAEAVVMEDEEEAVVMEDNENEGGGEDIDDFDEDPTPIPTLSPSTSPVGILTTPLDTESSFPTSAPGSSELPSSTEESEERVIFDRVLVPLVSFEIRLSISPHETEPLVEPAVARGSNDNTRSLRKKLIDEVRRLDGEDSFDVASIDFDRLTDAISKFLEGEIREFIRSQNIVKYSPLQLIVLTPVSGSGGGSRRVLDSGSTEHLLRRRSLHTDEVITVEYVGTALFLRSPGTKVPSGTIVGTIQKAAFSQRSDNLLDMIYATGADSGLLAASSVTADLLNDDGLGTFPTSSPTPVGGVPSKPLDGAAAIADSGESSKSTGLDIIIMAAIIVAVMSLVLLAAALFLAFRRKRKAMHFTAPGMNAQRHRSLGRTGTKSPRRVNSGASDGVTKDTSNSPNATPSESDFSESKLDDSIDIRGTPMMNQQPSLSTLAGLYPDDVIMDDINSSLAAYKNFDLYARGNGENRADGPNETLPSFPHRDDNASISSMESYSLAGDGYESSSVAASHIGSGMGNQAK